MPSLLCTGELPEDRKSKPGCLSHQVHVCSPQADRRYACTRWGWGGGRGAGFTSLGRTSAGGQPARPGGASSRPTCRRRPPSWPELALWEVACVGTCPVPCRAGLAGRWASPPELLAPLGTHPSLPSKHPAHGRPTPSLARVEPDSSLSRLGLLQVGAYVRARTHTRARARTRAHGTHAHTHGTASHPGTPSQAPLSSCARVRSHLHTRMCSTHTLPFIRTYSWLGAKPGR